MQDDARHRLDASANGHGRGPGDSMASTAAAGQQSDHRDALTEKNLDKHTRLNPPCARDTVAWFLQGLQPGLGAGANHSQVQVRHSTQEKAEASRNRQEPRHVSPIRQPDNDGEAIYGSQDLARMAADLPDGVPVEAPLAGNRLTEQRKFLLASMRSKHDKQARKKVYKTALPSVSSSPPSSAANLQEVERAVQVTIRDPSKHKQVPVVLAEETQPAMEVRFKDDKERAKRTLSDPDSTERARKEPRRRSVEQQEITTQVKGRSKSKQREKALQSVLTSETNPERQQGMPCNPKRACLYNADL